MQHARDRSRRAIGGSVDRHRGIDIGFLDDDESLRGVESNRRQARLVYASPRTIDVGDTHRDGANTAAKPAQRELQTPARKVGELRWDADSSTDRDAHSYLGVTPLASYQMGSSATRAQDRPLRSNDRPLGVAVVPGQPAPAAR
jgi:hypothetical protein